MKITKQRHLFAKDKGPTTPTSARLSQSSAFSPDAKPDDDWTHIEDSRERRRLQNRLAQRKYRRKKRNDREVSQPETFISQGTPAYWVSNEAKLHDQAHPVPGLDLTGQKPIHPAGPVSVVKNHHHVDAMAHPFGNPMGPVQGVLKEHQQPFISDLFPYDQTEPDHAKLFDAFRHEEKPTSHPAHHHHTSAFDSTYKYSRAMDSMIPAAPPENEHTRHLSQPVLPRSMSLPGEIISSTETPLGDETNDVGEPNPYLYPFHEPHMLFELSSDSAKREDFSYPPMMGDIPAMQAARMTIEASHQQDDQLSTAYTEQSDVQLGIDSPISLNHNKHEHAEHAEDFELQFNPFDRCSSPPDLELGSACGSRLSSPGSLPPSTPRGFKDFSHPSLFGMEDGKERNTVIGE